jgi:hypothetical protein
MYLYISAKTPANKEFNENLSSGVVAKVASSELVAARIVEDEFTVTLSQRVRCRVTE